MKGMYRRLYITFCFDFYSDDFFLVRTYAAILYQYSLHPINNNHAEKAQQVLKRMQKIHQDNPNTDVAKPKTLHYNTVITAWSKSLDVDNDYNITAVIQAETLLNEMKQIYQESGDGDIKPDVISYASVINAYCKFAKNKEVNIIDKVENLLEELESSLSGSHLEQSNEIYSYNDDNNNAKVVPVNTILYNNILNAYAKTRGLKSAEKADALLKRMEAFRANDVNKTHFYNLAPDAISYTSTINAW